ncbi:MAG: hypothetical protein ACKO2L_22595 [Planctomycetaceae bacterium]
MPAKTLLPAAIVGCFFSLLPQMLLAQAAIRLQTGKALEKTLAESVSCSVQRMPLTRQLDDIRQSGVCLIRDRRVDPSVPLSLQTGFLPRRELLKQLAALIPNTAASFTSDYVCIAPTPVAFRLPLLLQVIEQQAAVWRRLPASTIPRRTLLPVRPSWERPAIPAELLAIAARDAGIRITNPEAIPHDVWDSAELPAMSFPELACLVLNQFDLFPELDATAAEIRIVPVPTDRPLELRHSFPAELRAALEQLSGNGKPDTPIRWTRTTAVFTATLERHAQFAATIEQARSANGSSAGVPGNSLRTRTFQLQAERAPLGSIVATLRASGVAIEIAGEQTAIIQKRLQLVVPINAGEQTGEDFFKGLFGQHFGTVLVLDDRVQLRE